MAQVDLKVARFLSNSMPGRVSVPGDERYQSATAIWAGQSGRRPKAVIHCQSTDDVQGAIRMTRDSGLPLSVRGHGHDWAGRSLCDGIVIDMRTMNDVVTIKGNTGVKLGGGASVGDVLGAIEPLGLAVATGSSCAVGMVGLTLGGGYGPLIGRFGLALDNVVAADVVLADGQLVRASSDQEPELFWALRGGGGNFGVVTGMQLRAHHLPSVCSGILLYSFSDAGRVLKGCIEMAASAPDESTFQIAFLGGADGPPVLMIVPTWCGAAKEGPTRLADFARMAKPLVNTVAATSYMKSLRAFDAHVVNGNRVIIETCWLPRLDYEVANLLIEAMAKAISPGCAIVTHEFKGRASRVPLEASAFGLRQDHLLLEIIATFAADADPAVEERHRRWVGETIDSLRQKAMPGGYANLLADVCNSRVVSSFGRNATRLAQAKRRYDPANVFCSAIPIPDFRQLASENSS